MRADANVVLVREVDEIVLAPRRGLFGHSQAIAIRIPDEDIVGAVEDIKALGGWCTKLGVMVMAQLVGHNLAMGTDGLAKQLAKWAGIDLTKLQAEIDEDEAVRIAQRTVAEHAGGDSESQTVGEPSDLGPVAADTDGPAGPVGLEQPSDSEGRSDIASTETEGK